MKLSKTAISEHNKELFAQLKFSRGAAAIIMYMLDGLNTPQIMAETGLSLAGVTWHKTRIYKKLEVRNGAEAATKLAALGFKTKPVIVPFDGLLIKGAI